MLGEDFSDESDKENEESLSSDVSSLFSENMAKRCLQQKNKASKEAKNAPSKKKKTPAKKTTQLDIPWQKRDINPSPINLPVENGVPSILTSTQRTPVEYFELFFDDVILELMTLETNRYAAERKNKSLNVVKEEVKVLLGILILSGYCSVSRRRMYWETGKDVHHALVSGAIRRDRFEEIFSCLHFADNNHLNGTDKFAKIRPLMTRLNTLFLQYAPSTECHSFDESMVEYFGKHGCKQMIRNKPIRFGFKMWCGATHHGYMVWFDPYQGKGSCGAADRGLGLGGNLVAHYAHILLDRAQIKYHLFCDNFFSSRKLMIHLKSVNVQCTGTVRENRLDNCPLVSKATMKKTERGENDYKVDTANEVIFVKWNDNSVVNMCSNAVGIEPKATAKRYSAKERSQINVSQPACIHMYNKCMGGVDRFDENVNKYRVAIRGKKWYSSIVTYCIDAAISNAWMLYRLSDNNPVHDLLSFRRTISTYYLQSYGVPSIQGRKGKSSNKANQALARYDMKAHWIVPQEKQTRCAHCHAKCTTRCEKCDVGLHVKCFKVYHTEQ